MDRYSTSFTKVVYTLRRRLQSPAGNDGDIIFCVDNTF